MNCDSGHYMFQFHILIKLMFWAVTLNSLPKWQNKKKVAIFEAVDFDKFYFHHGALVKLRLLGEYQHRRWRNNDQGGLNSIFNFVYIYLWIFIFTLFTKCNRKTHQLWHENPMFRWSMTLATICYNFISWSSLCSELWSWKVCPSDKTRKKWRFLKWLISIKFYFHHGALFKLRLLGEYQQRRRWNIDQGGLNSSINVFAFYL
jgi:hypothetical protein